MITVRIKVEPYLAAYMYARYQTQMTPAGIALHLPPREPLYHTIHQLTVPFPTGHLHREVGNLHLVLPDPHYGKNPETYNYLGEESIKILRGKMDEQMRMELYDYMLTQHFRLHWSFKMALETFVDAHGMEDLIEETTLMRAFQRWREKGRNKKNG